MTGFSTISEPSLSFLHNSPAGIPAAEPSSPPGALYLRLSKDDEGSGESLSIANQRKLLLRYASEHHFPIIREYVDDGCSGTTFDRPGFRRMIEDIEKKEIRLILTKDLSRLGRDYIMTGHYTEFFFPSRGVRFIAVGDGYDSASSSPDLIPFRNVLNEMYARDISRKIRSSLRVRMEEGSYIGNFAPYGYEITGKSYRSLIPDPEAAPIVRFLFQKAAKGIRPSALAGELNEKGILCPSEHRRKKAGGRAMSESTALPSEAAAPWDSGHAPKPDPAALDPALTSGHAPDPGSALTSGLAPASLGPGGQPSRAWTANTIIKLLHNPVYLGHMVQGKTRKLSFKSSLCRIVPPEERIIVPDTHFPLVPEEIFLRCQEQLDSRRCQKGSGRPKKSQKR